MEFLPKEIESYCDNHTSPENEVLKNLNRHTHLNVMQPRMLSGHFQGRFLSMLSNMIKPKYILEIGTYTAYAAICLAEGLPENGKLITIDNNEELQDLVHDQIKKGNFEDKIIPILGNAMDILPTLNYDFDMVFIDADKSNYINYYNMLIDKLKPGAYIIADNMLWSGKILMDSEKMDLDTLTIHQYNEMLMSDNRVEQILLPIRDGLSVARKL